MTATDKAVASIAIIVFAIVAMEWLLKIFENRWLKRKWDKSRERRVLGR